MNQDGMYNKVVQEYYYLNKEKRELIHERDNIGAKLEIIENILTDLNAILCKHGKHIYEHFEENEPQESEETPWYLNVFNPTVLKEFQRGMRDATPEEKQSVQDYIDSISQEVPYNDEGSSIHSEVYKEEGK